MYRSISTNNSIPSCPTEECFGAEDTAQFMLVVQKILRAKNLWSMLNVNGDLGSDHQFSYACMYFEV